MIRNGDGIGRLKVSNKCSVWQRHTYGMPYTFQQPDGLQHNHDVRHIVAARQAAFMGGTVHQGRCHWATSVPARWAIVRRIAAVHLGLHLPQPVGLSSYCQQSMFYN